MSNATESDSDLVLGSPVVLGPAVAVASLLVILLGIAVILFGRNRQIRIARLRERIGLAESRVNALLRIQQVLIKVYLEFYVALWPQMAEVKKGVNKQGSDEINKGKDESIRNNDTTPPVNTSSTQQTKPPQSTNQPLTTITVTEHNCRTSAEKHSKMNGHGAMGSSLESLDDASHVAVVNQSLYNGSTCLSYGEMHLVHNGDHKRSNNLFSLLDQDGGYSSSQVEGWV